MRHSSGETSSKTTVPEMDTAISVMESGQIHYGRKSQNRRNSRSLGHFRCVVAVSRGTPGQGAERLFLSARRAANAAAWARRSIPSLASRFET